MTPCQGQQIWRAYVWKKSFLSKYPYHTTRILSNLLHLIKNLRAHGQDIFCESYRLQRDASRKHVLLYIGTSFYFFWLQLLFCYDIPIYWKFPIFRTNTMKISFVFFSLSLSVLEQTTCFNHFCMATASEWLVIVGIYTRQIY